MILQALNDYYHRLLDDPDTDVPEFGFGILGVHYCLCIDENGEPVNTFDLTDDDDRPTRMEVPVSEARTVGISPFFAWDNTGYVLGVDDKGKPERTARTHQAFKDFTAKVLDGVDDDGARALLAFLDKWTPDQYETLAYHEKMLGKNIVFMLNDINQYLHQRPAFRDAWKKYQQEHGPELKGMCLVTGEKNAPIPPTHDKIKGVFRAQTSGASLISFNFPAAVSFGREQNLNAPVGEKAAFAYTTALNLLLAPDNPRKVRLTESSKWRTALDNSYLRKAQIGETTIVFWTDSPGGETEALTGMSLGAKKVEDQDLINRLEGHLRAMVKGEPPEELGKKGTLFYILGLSPNAARLSVRFWEVETVESMVENIGAHYRAMAIKRSFDSDPEFPTPWMILKELAPQRDSRNISPLLTGQLIKSIIKGHAYPRTLLTAAISRIRADKVVNYLRAAIIKAYLVRDNSKNKQEQEIHMTLDRDNQDIGYRLGRLFAVLEKIQSEAVPGANATVKDRFFSSATATPGRTFPIILKNAQHGLAKVRKLNERHSLFYEKQLQEILGQMDPNDGFPKTLPLEKQGLFILGYYQQRQDLYTKKQDKEQE